MTEYKGCFLSNPSNLCYSVTFAPFVYQINGWVNANIQEKLTNVSICNIALFHIILSFSSNHTFRVTANFLMHFHRYNLFVDRRNWRVLIFALFANELFATYPVDEASCKKKKQPGTDYGVRPALICVPLSSTT